MMRFSTDFGSSTGIYASWWLNQPTWNICSSNWIISPGIRVKIKDILKPPPSWGYNPPSNHILTSLDIQVWWPFPILYLSIGVWWFLRFFRVKPRKSIQAQPHKHNSDRSWSPRGRGSKGASEFSYLKTFKQRQASGKMRLYNTRSVYGIYIYIVYVYRLPIQIHFSVCF